VNEGQERERGGGENESVCLEREEEEDAMRVRW
jgi:hypothetical protein